MARHVKQKEENKKGDHKVDNEFEAFIICSCAFLSSNGNNCSFPVLGCRKLILIELS